MFGQHHSIKRVLATLSGLLLGLAPAAALADTIYVCWDGSGDYLTIHGGIYAASDGDEVVVCDGVYTGAGNTNLDFVGKAITVRSENGPDHCTISGGTAFVFEGGETRASVVGGFTIRDGGPGIQCMSASSPTIRDCVITENDGFIFGGGITCMGAASPLIVNCTIADNEADMYGGGAIFSLGSNPIIINCTIAGNRAEEGSALYFVGGSPLVLNCTITGNPAGYTGAVYIQDSAPTIINSTVADNPNGGFYIDTLDLPLIQNSIIWGGIYALRAQPVVRYSLVHQGGWEGPGNFDADPLFVDPDGPDDDPNTWEDNDYHLGVGSPCIDAGCNGSVPPDVADLDDDGDTREITPLDLDGEGRFFDDPDTDDTGGGIPPIVDIGAYEFGGTGPQPCPGDLDGDRDVDQSDLGILLAAWHSSDEGDLNCDGLTDHSDLGILLGHWGEVCP